MGRVKLARLTLMTLMLMVLAARALAQVPTPPPTPGADPRSTHQAPASGPEHPSSATPAVPAYPQVMPGGPRRLVLSQPMITRARRLGSDLDVLGRRSGGRVTAGVIQISVGAAFATLGAVLSNEIGRSLLLLVGAGTIAHGVFQLTLVEDAESLRRAYEDMPVFTPQQLAERVRFGEQALQRIAHGARRARIADGSVAMTVAAVYVPLLWWLESRQHERYRFGDSAFDYVALALSGINFASGLVTALVSSEAEQRLRDYETLRSRQTDAPPAPAALSLRFGAVRAGASMAARLVF